MFDTSSKKTALAFLFILTVAVIGGGVSVFVKIAVQQLPPLTFTFLRFLLAFLCILPLFLKEKPKFTKDTFGLVFFSLLATANVTLFAFGIKLTTAIAAQVLYASVPIIVGVFSYFFLKSPLTTSKVLGIVFGLVGTLLIIFLPLIGKTQAVHGSLLGNALILVAVIAFSMYTVFSKTYQKKYSPTYVTMIFFMTTLVVEFFLSLSELKTFLPLINTITPLTLISLLFTGILGSFLYYLLFQYVIKRSSPLITSMLFYLQPVATLVWAAILLGEHLTSGFLVGAAFSLFGAWLVTKK